MEICGEEVGRKMLTLSALRGNNNWYGKELGQGEVVSVCGNEREGGWCEGLDGLREIELGLTTIGFVPSCLGPPRSVLTPLPARLGFRIPARISARVSL